MKDMIENKKCTQCKETKTINNFRINTNYADGFTTECIQCKSVKRKKYYQKNKNKEKLYQKTYFERNKEKCLEINRNYRKNNPEKVKNWKKSYRKKIQKNPFLKINHNMGCSLRQSLLSKKNGRHWEQLVGYTVEDLIYHLESKFQKGMTWENYGKWHVDHIKPQSSFSFSDETEEQFKKCWSLSNLQPLWAIDNLKKFNKLTSC
jgi:hypothetical protein